MVCLILSTCSEEAVHYSMVRDITTHSLTVPTDKGVFIEAASPGIMTPRHTLEWSSLTLVVGSNTSGGVAAVTDWHLIGCYAIVVILRG